MITIVNGKVDSLSDLQGEILLKDQEQSAIATCVVNGTLLLRVATGAACGSPTATLSGIEVSYETSGANFRNAESISMERAMDTAHREYAGPAITGKALIAKPARLRLYWVSPTLDESNYFNNVIVGLLTETK